MCEGDDRQAERRHRKHAVAVQRGRRMSIHYGEAATWLGTRGQRVSNVSGGMELRAGRMTRFLDAGEEPRLREQRVLHRRRPLERENHYRLKTNAEAPFDSCDHALTLCQFGCGMSNRALIYVAAEPMPYEASGKILHRLEVITARACMARGPCKIRMRPRAEMIDMTEQSGHRCGVEMIEIHRPIVDHQVERRQRRPLYPGRVIGRDQRPCVLTTRLAMSQPLQERSGGAGFVIQVQILDYASAAVPEGEDCCALNAVDVAYEQQLLHGSAEASLHAR